MNNKLIDGDYTTSAFYQIVVRGRVDKRYIGLLNELTITHQSLNDQVVSTITGEVIDQSALCGILNTLIDHHYPVIAVNKID